MTTLTGAISPFLGKIPHPKCEGSSLPGVPLSGNTSLVPANVVHPHDPWVRQSPRKAGLRREPLNGALVCHKVRMENLDRAFLAQIAIHNAVDCPHASSTKQFLNDILPAHHISWLECRELTRWHHRSQISEATDPSGMTRRAWRTRSGSRPPTVPAPLVYQAGDRFKIESTLRAEAPSLDGLPPTVRAIHRQSLLLQGIVRVHIGRTENGERTPDQSGFVTHRNPR